MSSTNESPTEAAERLEHALERIALAMATSMARPGMEAGGTAVADPVALREAEVTKKRLDALIDKLRAGLLERTR